MYPEGSPPTGTSTTPPQDSGSRVADRGGELELSNAENEAQSPESAAKDPCLGCQRTFMSDMSWFVEHGPTQWAFPKGRGAWCRDCHTCWRTCYSHEHSLHLFGAWLRFRANYRKWQCTLVAFLSLVREEHAKITLQMVVEREQTIEFLSGLLGFNFSRPSVVVPLTQLERGVTLDGKMLVTMQTESGFRVGVQHVNDGLQGCPISGLATKGCTALPAGSAVVGYELQRGPQDLAGQLRQYCN